MKQLQRCIAMGLIALCWIVTPAVVHGQATFEWAKKIGGTQADAGNAVVTDISGNVYTVGTFMDTVDFNPGTATFNLIAQDNADAFVSKVDASGNFVWAKQFKGSVASTVNAKGISTDVNGNVYVIGTFSDTIDFNPGAGVFNLVCSAVTPQFTAQYTDAFICKLDASGNFIWAKQFKGSMSVDINDIQTTSNRIYVLGRFRDTVDLDPSVNTYDLHAAKQPYFTSVVNHYNGYVTKLDTAGNLIWAKNVVDSYSTAVTRGISIDGAENIYIDGYFSSMADFDPSPTASYILSGYSADAFISKLDSAGNFQWAKSWGTSGGQWSYDNSVDPWGNVYVVTFNQGTTDFDPGPDTFNISKLGTVVSKLNTSGIFQWARLISPLVSTQNSSGFGLATDLLGAVYVTGRFQGVNDFDPGADTFNLNSIGGLDVYVWKLDTAGSFLWAKAMGGTGDDIGQSITVDDDGNIYTTGTFSTAADFDPSTVTYNLVSGGGTDVFIHKMSQDFCVPTSMAITLTGCDSLALNGQTYYASGTYNQTLINADGCDSLLTIYLTINTASQNTIIMPAQCDSISVNGETYTTSGTFTQMHQNAKGCDSTLYVVVTINNSTVDTLNETACKSFVFNGHTYTQSGFYPVSYSGSLGCDSTVILHLTIPDINTAVTHNGAVLHAGATGVGYQWFNCTTQTVIFGANGQSYTASANGSYAVIITQGGCKDTSGCTTVSITGIAEVDNGNQVRIYPNPAEGKVTITASRPLHNATVTLTDIAGKIIKVQTKINGDRYSLDITSFAPGVYIAEIEEEGRKAILKLVKQ